MTEAELESAVGWTRRQLEAPGARVTGASTYRHMEWMHARPRYGEFVLAAVLRHGAASLGVVGLASKTAPTVGDALACHARYQHLTNRTAAYRTRVERDSVWVEEQRHGEASLGSRLVSDYTMMVAVQLLRTVSAEPFQVLEVHSRRASLGPDERARYTCFLGAPIHLGAERASLVFERAVLSAPTASADPELAAYFDALLARVSAGPDAEPALLRDVRTVIRERLLHGTPSIAEVSRALAVGARTLQRRLAKHDTTFAEVLDSTRRTLAEGYLRDTELSSAEIAYLLGYREQASFFRAFRRWHEVTPEAYRRGSAVPGLRPDETSAG